MAQMSRSQILSAIKSGLQEAALGQVIWLTILAVMIFRFLAEPIAGRTHSSRPTQPA